MDRYTPPMVIPLLIKGRYMNLHRRDGEAKYVVLIDFRCALSKAALSELAPAISDGLDRLSDSRKARFFTAHDNSALGFFVASRYAPGAFRDALLGKTSVISTAVVPDDADILVSEIGQWATHGFGSGMIWLQRN